MAATKTHGIYNIGIGIAAPTMIGGVTDLRAATDPQFRAETAGGEIYPRGVAFTGQIPQGSFITYHVAKALAAIGLTGYDVNSAATPATSLYLYLQKFATGSTREGVTAHIQYQGHRGIIVPRTLTVGYDADAAITYDFYLIKAGGNDPIVKTGSVTLPVAAADDERFTLGPMQIGGNVLTGLRRWTLDFNVAVRTEKADNDTWPTNVWISSIAPSLELIGIDPDWMYDAANDIIKLSGNAAAHADTIFYLRKWDEDNVSVVADGTAEHVKFTMAGIAAISQPFAVSGSDPAETGIKMQSHYDGTNAPVVVNTASAIT